jgi:hypothetical protein
MPTTASTGGRSRLTGYVENEVVFVHKIIVFSLPASCEALSASHRVLSFTT